MLLYAIPSGTLEASKHILPVPLHHSMSSCQNKSNELELYVSRGPQRPLYQSTVTANQTLDESAQVGLVSIDKTM